MPVEIAPVRMDQAEAVRVALDSVARERRYLLLVEGPPVEAVVSYLHSMAEAGNPYFVALDGDRVVGGCDVVADSRVGLTHTGRLGIFVVDGYRGQGVGRRLMGAVLAAAWEQGLTRIELEVLADNARAIRLYESLGFEHEGRRRNAAHPRRPHAGLPRDGDRALRGSALDREVGERVSGRCGRTRGRRRRRGRGPPWRRSARRGRGSAQCVTW